MTWVPKSIWLRAWWCCKTDHLFAHLWSACHTVMHIHQIMLICEKAVLELDILPEVSFLPFLRFKKGFKTKYCHLHVILLQSLTTNHTCNHLRCIYSQMIYILQFMASFTTHPIWSRSQRSIRISKARSVLLFFPLLGSLTIFSIGGNLGDDVM